MFKFTPSTIPHNIFVIGAGGTGGRLIPMLSQFLRSITRGQSAVGWVEAPTIWLIDDDVVEQKNILRQNFIDMDVGKHKAAVLAERYSRAYGVNIVPILQKVEPSTEDDLYNIIDQTIYATTNTHPNVNQLIQSSIVVMCVDSVRARRDILNTFTVKCDTGNGLAGRTFFIDAGNEDNFGQVSFFNPVIALSPESYDSWPESYRLPKLVPVTADSTYIPLPYSYYKDLVDTPAQGSCADLNQTLAINAIMATTIMGIIQNYYYRKPMTYNTVSISLDGGNFVTHNTFNVFKNRALPYQGAASISCGRDYVKEKDGAVTTMRFAARCSWVEVVNMVEPLTNAIAQMKKEAEREEKKRQAEERKLAERKVRLEELRVAKEERAKAKAQTSKTTESTEAVAEPIPAPAPAAVPELTPVRRVRQRVELQVPDAWGSRGESAAETPYEAAALADVVLQDIEAQDIEDFVEVDETD